MERVRRFDICNLQPIFGPYIPDGEGGPRVILPDPRPRETSELKDGLFMRR